VCEANVVDRIDLIATILGHDTNDAVTAETGFIAPGETYYWLVDVCDHNYNGTGDPCMLPGPLFSYVKWGFAELISPENEAGDVDAGTVELLFEGDGYQDSFVVYLLDEGDNELENSGTLTADSNSWTPSVSLGLSQTYKWYVEECNDWQGSELCVATETWTFTTAICKTIDDFEGYADLGALQAVWKDYGDTGSSGTNAAEVSALTKLQYDIWGDPINPEEVYEGEQAMTVTWDEQFIANAATQPDDYTWIVPADSNLAADGGKSVWVAYRPSASSGPNPANNEVMWMGFDDGTNNDVIMYPGESDDANQWSVFYVALSETTNADETSIDEIRLGMSADSTGGGQITASFDLLVRCGAVCPYDYGYPDLAEGAFAPDYTKLDADILGPERDYLGGLPGGTSGPDCIVSGWDIVPMLENWLTEDYTYSVAEPNADKLLVHYDFNDVTTVVTDLSGNDYHGAIDVCSPNFTVNGIAIFEGDDFIEVAPGDFNAVHPFNDSFAVVIEFRVPVEDGSKCLISNAPNEPFDVETWDRAFDMKTNHWAEGEGDVFQRNHEDFTELYPGEGAFHDGWHTVIGAYDAETGIRWTYLDGVLQTGEWAPELTEPLDRYQTLIGDTLDLDNDDSNPLVGDINDVKIYADVNEAEIRFLVGEEVGTYEVPVDELANWNVDGAFGDNIINFLDHAMFSPDWDKYKPFE
jgi:hypothetical protein